jgi:transposase
MTSDLTITTERIDDFPLLLETLKRLGLPEILDQRLPRHGLHQGLSWGWIATIWLAHMLTESDHRKVHVQAWVHQAHETIERITGLKVGELDFTDDRLTRLLQRLSQPATWQAIETDLGRNILRVYELTPERVRLDGTTVSGYHAGGAESLFQFGHSKDDPTLRQVKVMMATLDPLGLPLATDVVAGSSADDPLYCPAVDRVLTIIEGVGLLFVGDCKMSALATRAHIHHLGQHYLCPLAMTGSTAKELADWIQVVNDGRVTLQPVHAETPHGPCGSRRRRNRLDRTGLGRALGNLSTSPAAWPRQPVATRYDRVVGLDPTPRAGQAPVPRRGGVGSSRRRDLEPPHRSGFVALHF